MNDATVSSSKKLSSIFPTSLASNGWANDFIRESASHAAQAVAISSTFLVGDGFDAMAASDPFVSNPSIRSAGAAINDSNNSNTTKSTILSTILDQLNEKDSEENRFDSNVTVSRILSQAVPDNNVPVLEKMTNPYGSSKHNDDSDDEEDDPIMSLVKQSKRTRTLQEMSTQQEQVAFGNRNTVGSLPLSNAGSYDDYDDNDNKSWSTETSTESLQSATYGSKDGVRKSKKHSNRFMNDLDNRISQPSKPVPESYIASTSTTYQTQKSSDSISTSTNINGIELSTVFSSLKKFGNNTNEHKNQSTSASNSAPPPLARPKRTKISQAKQQQQSIDSDNVVKISSSELMLNADEERAMLLLSSTTSSGSNNVSTINEVAQSLYQVLFKDQTSKSSSTTTSTTTTSTIVSSKKRRQSMIVITSFIVAIGIFILYKVTSSVGFSTSSITGGEIVGKNP